MLRDIKILVYVYRIKAEFIELEIMSGQHNSTKTEKTNEWIKHVLYSLMNCLLKQKHYV